MTYRALNLAKGHQAYSYEPASSQDVAAVQNGDKNLSPFVEGKPVSLDFGPGWRTSTWNDMFWAAMATVLQEYGAEAGYPAVSTEYLEARTIRIVGSLKHTWSASQTRLNPATGAAEDQEATFERQLKTDQEAGKRDTLRNFRATVCKTSLAAHHYLTSIQKLNRRIATVEMLIALATDLKHASLQQWQYIHRMLTQLGNDAMSDEENAVIRPGTSDGSVINLIKARRIRQPGFRLRELTKIFILLDKANGGNRVHAPDVGEMARRTQIVRSDDVNPAQRPPKECPIVFLDADWLLKTQRASHRNPDRVSKGWTVPSVAVMEACLSNLLQLTV